MKSHNIVWGNDNQSTQLDLQVWNKKRAHIFELLARLAYNKGTALFRGNNPLWRSVAETFYGSTHPHRHTSHAGCGSDRTRNGNIHAQRWTQEGGCMLKFTQLYLNAAFVLSCWNQWIVRWTPENYGPEPKECDGKVRYAILSARLSETPAVVAASVGITYETKQSETPLVCRQQAELRQYILLLANIRKLDMTAAQKHIKCIRSITDIPGVQFTKNEQPSSHFTVERL